MGTEVGTEVGTELSLLPATLFLPSLCPTAVPTHSKVRKNQFFNFHVSVATHGVMTAMRKPLTGNSHKGAAYAAHLFLAT